MNAGIIVTETIDCSGFERVGCTLSTIEMVRHENEEGKKMEDETERGG